MKTKPKLPIPQQKPKQKRVLVELPDGTKVWKIPKLQQVYEEIVQLETQPPTESYENT